MSDPKYAEIDPDWLQPNTWNPNRMNAFMYAKELQSIKDHGIVDPITVRKVGENRFEIIDGEHRWRAVRDLGYRKVPVYILDVDELEAKKLTILLNELRGQALPADMGTLLKDLMKHQPLESLLDELPYTEEMFRGLTELPPLPDFPLGKKPEPEPEKRWVERLYRMPIAAATVLDDAIKRAKEGEAIEDWQAIERIAADFLAG